MTCPRANTHVKRTKYCEVGMIVPNNYVTSLHTYRNSLPAISAYVDLEDISLNVWLFIPTLPISVNFIGI